MLPPCPPGLKFETQVCSMQKFERNECEPGDEPIECDYPTKYGCMDVTYEWLMESTTAMVRPPAR